MAADFRIALVLVRAVVRLVDHLRREDEGAVRDPLEELGIGTRGEGGRCGFRGFHEARYTAGAPESKAAEMPHRVEAEVTDILAVQSRCADD